MTTWWSADRRDFQLVLSTTLDLEPRGKGRPRVTRNGTFTPKETREWEAAAATLLRLARSGAPTITTPTEVVIQTVTTRPKSYPKSAGAGGVLWRPSKPDVDNITKSVLDALIMAGVIADDNLVVRLQVETMTAAVGMPPCVRVRVAALVDIA